MFCQTQTGWGKFQHPGNSHYLLQQLAMIVLDKATCAKKNSVYNKVTDQMLCATNVGNGASEQSGCHGDSGGPFSCKNPNGSWTLHGVVSWGSPRCRITDAYTVFARVGKFRDWVDQKMQK